MTMRNSAIIMLAAAMSLTAACKTETVEIYPIQDNAEMRLMQRGLFPDAPDSLISELGLEAGIPSSICAFLVKTEGKEILFDAANGAPDSQLIPTLRSMEISPEDIDHIFITHLHGDHIGGLMHDDAAAFTNAQLHINKTELDAWLAMPQEQSAQISKIVNAYGERLKTFVPEDELPYGISAVEAYGHTPGHTLYRLGDIVIAGDIMHGTALQAAYPQFNARFDMDQAKASEARKALIRHAAEESLKVYGMHFPAPHYLEF